jgi:hypothetical protein
LVQAFTLDHAGDAGTVLPQFYLTVDAIVIVTIAIVTIIINIVTVSSIIT